MRYFYIIVFISAFVFSGCNQQPQSKDYPEADALYLNLNKTFILNKDGSITEKVEKQQKIFTYMAFSRKYGETRIPYNPEFQEVKVSESFTVMADGKKVESPENAYNEVLPRYCANSKAYNNIRELVVSHTALERNAVINCKYEIKTKSGFYPFLMGDEVLVQSSPVKNMKIEVRVPEGTELNYRLFGIKTKPEKSKDGNEDVYVWKFKNLPQHLAESHEPVYDENVPRLIFSTQTDRKSMIGIYSKQAAFKTGGFNMPEYVKKAVSTENTDLDKALKIQQIVVDEINLLHIPGTLTGFRYRTPEEVWESNSGTPVEKAVLMSSLLSDAGIVNVICMEYPNLFSNEKTPFILAATPVVVSTGLKDNIYLSPVSKNSNTEEICKPGFSCVPIGNKVELPVIFKPVTGEILLSGELSLSESNLLKGFFVGDYSGSADPFLKIKASPNAVKDLMPGWKSKPDILSENEMKVVFSGETKSQTRVRDNYCFVNLPVSTGGISAKHLLPLNIERKTRFYFGHPLKETYRYTLTVPQGYQLIDKNISKNIKTTAGSLSIKIKQNEDKVTVDKTLEIFKPAIPVSEYPGFKELLAEWNLKKYNELVFRMK